MTRRRSLAALAVALCTLGACSRAEPFDDEAARPTDGSATEGVASAALSAEQRRRADQLISAFENSTTDIDYAYAENLGDGRGVTSGRAGFTTATCDAAEVVRLYSERTSPNPLQPFTAELDRLCESESDATDRLPERAYMAAWRAAAGDASFRRAQDDVVEATYFRPAMERADSVGLRSAVGRVALYDTAIQHGAGDDDDGLDAIIARTDRDIGPLDKVGEDRWLDAFFDARIETLRDPANDATREAWAASTDRVECLRRIAATGNVALAGPLTFTVYGDTYSIA